MFFLIVLVGFIEYSRVFSFSSDSEVSITYNLSVGS